jgi:hypothetical protein
MIEQLVFREQVDPEFHEALQADGHGFRLPENARS